MRGSRLAIVGLALAAGACEKSKNPAAPAGSLATLQVVNGAAGGAVDVLLDGRVAVANVVSGGFRLDTVTAGTHVLETRRVTGGVPGLQRSITLDSGTTRTVVVIDSSSVLNPQDITDTNAIVPSGASKLRVGHFASNAGAITIRRTQPDWATPIEIMIPFPYRAVSPYLQSTPGSWTVIVSHTGQADTIATTGDIAVGDGQRRTVVLVDSPAGGIGLLVLEP
jgi:hypothetical protein